MPIISPSTYTPTSFLWRNGHVQTVLPSIVKRLYPAFYRRERLEMADGDFLDIDWSMDLFKRKSRVAVICHGLEGSSRAPYTKGMARAFRRSGWDVVLMNFRSCSGELNRLPRSYHSGETEDLDFVVKHVSQHYHDISLIGFSLGGNVVLKYLGERAENISNRLTGAVTFSVPCDLAGSGGTLKASGNTFYMKRFLRMLEKKVRAKYLRGDGIAAPDSIKGMSSFWEFDDIYTAPLHGFSGADDYYKKSSSRQYLSKISIPALLINALNDPFLSPECFPETEAINSTYFHLEAPDNGGHCGFPTTYLMGTQWHEKRAIEFLNEQWFREESNLL